MKRREIGIGIVVDRAGRILICKRRIDQPLGGLWEFPGGKLEAGETIEQCIVREIEEETGLRVRPTRPLEAIEHAYEDVYVCLRPWMCEVLDHGQAGPDGPDGQSGQGGARAIECDEVRWVEASDLSAYPFPPANAPLLRTLTPS